MTRGEPAREHDVESATSPATLAYRRARAIGSVHETAIGLARVIDGSWSATTHLLGSVDLGDDPGPGSVGRAHEVSVAAQERKARGVHYTPPAIADGLVVRSVAASTDQTGPVDLRIGDPSCGGGAFLLAAAEELRRRGGAPQAIVEEQLFGIDLDPVAVAVCRVELALWCAAHTGHVHLPPETHVVVADGLEARPRTWPGWPVDGFDLVVGNPPFGSQLLRRTARDPARAARIVAAFGLPRMGYVDEAVLFLVAALDLVRVGGRVTMILPRSVLAARDAGEIRADLARRADLEELWIGTGAEFVADVQVWAPSFRRRAARAVEACADSAATPGPVARSIGATFHPVTPARGVLPEDASWGHLVGDLFDGFLLTDTDVLRHATETLSSVAELTAGFRSQFYGLAPHVVERAHIDSDRRRRTAQLVTSGVIDPLHDRRMTTAVTFAGRHLDVPVVDVSAVEAHDDRLGRWVNARLVPKVLVASQGAVVEAIVDTEGDLLPSTPVISVEPRPDLDVDVHLIAAALCAPVVSAWVRNVAAGSGLSARSVRVSARLLAAAPLPVDRDAWQRGAVLVREATAAARAGESELWHNRLDELAAVMTVAHGLEPDHPVVAWWHTQRPGWR